MSIQPRVGCQVWSLYPTLDPGGRRLPEPGKRLRHPARLPRKASRCRTHLFISILAYFPLSNIEHRTGRRAIRAPRRRSALCSAPYGGPPSRAGIPILASTTASGCSRSLSRSSGAFLTSSASGAFFAGSSPATAQRKRRPRKRLPVQVRKKDIEYY